MMLDQTRMDCQIPCLQQIAAGNADMPNRSLLRQLKLLVRRRLSPSREREIKKTTDNFVNWFNVQIGRAPRPIPAATPVALSHLQAGDLVRVKSQVEIAATLNNWRQLKGCTFMPEMVRFCGTTQRVLKPMRRFVDERDLRAKKCNGIVLLEGAMCQGTADFGPCDRSCFLFWREEWLEPIPDDYR
jgi:hypothetical protein